MDRAGGIRAAVGRGPLAAAEAKRAAGAWREAADLYAAHLAASPEDHAARIRLGQCLQEAGDAAAALAAYRLAEPARPYDADLQIRLGQMARRAGDLAAARAAFARAFDLDPAGETAWQELAGLLATAPVAPPAGLALDGDLRIAFDLSDLFSWFGTHRAPSGIQRIQIEVAAAALAGALPAAGLRLAVFRPDRLGWREMPREAFLRLAALSRASADVSEGAWGATRAQVEALLDAAGPMEMPAGSWLVNLGTSWQLDGYHLAVRDAQARGLRYAALVHDTGPVTVPEHSEPASSARFAQWFSELVVTADLLLAVSEATRRDMLTLAGARLPGMPIAPIALLRPDARPVAPRPVAHARVRDLAGEPYILFLGTIESRKDHLFVLNAWLALLRRHGAKVPKLVLAGRAGFGSGPAIALLRRAPALEGRVLWLDDVPDGAMAELHRNALFAIYHSAHEGWGLPVTEALAAVKAVVTPAHSGLVEAAQGLALHYAPGSEPEFLAAVETLLFEPGARKAAEDRIAAELRLRDWRMVAAELAELLAAAPDGPPALPPPPLGTVHRLAAADSARPEPAQAWADRIRVGTFWHAPEAWGCRTRPGRALLRLPLPPAEGPLRIHLALRGAPADRAWSARCRRRRARCWCWTSRRRRRSRRSCWTSPCPRATRRRRPASAWSPPWPARRATSPRAWNSWNA
jgi:glycosyltransferase involved in cell wall biosynthesis